MDLADISELEMSRLRSIMSMEEKHRERDLERGDVRDYAPWCVTLCGNVVSAWRSCVPCHEKWTRARTYLTFNYAAWVWDERDKNMAMHQMVVWKQWT